MTKQELEQAAVLVRKYAEEQAAKVQDHKDEYAIGWWNSEDWNNVWHFRLTAAALEQDAKNA